MLFGPGIFHPARVVFSVTAIPRSQRRQHHISSKKSVRILWCEGHAPTERDCERDRPPPPPTPPTLLTHRPVGTTPSPTLPSRSVPFQWCPLKKLLLLLWYCYEPLNIYMSFPATIRPNKLCQTHKPPPRGHRSWCQHQNVFENLQYTPSLILLWYYWNFTYSIRIKQDHQCSDGGIFVDFWIITFHIPIEIRFGSTNTCGSLNSFWSPKSILSFVDF